MKTSMSKILGGLMIQALAVAWATGCGSVDDASPATDDVAPATDSAKAETGTSREPLSYGWHGFAWINAGTVGYPYAYVNGSGGTITVTNGSTGNYTVTFPGIAGGSGAGAGGNVQVVAYGSGSERCKVSSWGASGANELVNVHCNTAAGAAVNTSFVVQFARPPGFGPGAFLWSDQPSSAAYNVASTWSWNSTGGTNRITRASAGVYTAFLPGLAASGGSVQVTGYGSTADHCKVTGWGGSGTDQSVTVRCFSGNTPVDSYFSLNYYGPSQVNAFDYGAYAWANDSTSASYTPSASWSYDSGTINGWPGCAGWIGSNSAGRNSAGSYYLRHTLLSPSNSAVHVTAYGSDSKYCKVTGWFGAPGGGTQVNTQCFTSAGVLSDTPYVETYSTSLVRGPC
jgi:hypothetical protein